MATDSSKDRILYLLKTKGPQTATALSKKLGVTAMAVRQHLYAMQKEGLVGHEDHKKKVGRPARFWKVTTEAQKLFPDNHGDLAVGLISAAREAFGEGGLQTLMEKRIQDQLGAYKKELQGLKTLEEKLAKFSALRSEEGYMASWKKNKEGTHTFTENHCPICAAADACQMICEGELSMLQKLLGPKFQIDRTEHILNNARSCVYQITPK